jgi:hypothetical protein
MNWLIHISIFTYIFILICICAYTYMHLYIFICIYICISIGAEKQAMLDKLGFSSLDELMDSTIPPAIRLAKPLQMDPPMSESQALSSLKVHYHHNILYLYICICILVYIYDSSGEALTDGPPFERVTSSHP